MAQEDAVLSFLHNAHIFASTVREVMGDGYLRRTSDYEISYPQFELLRLIERTGRHQVREMAAFLGVSQAAASRSVDKLVRLGLVTRETQPDDRRAVSLYLTGRGRSLIRKYDELKEEKIRSVLDGLSEELVEALTLGLGTVALGILQEEAEPGHVCMKCSAYCVDNCPVESLADDCIYHQRVERAQHPMTRGVEKQER